MACFPCGASRPAAKTFRVPVAAASSPSTPTFCFTNVNTVWLFVVKCFYENIQKGQSEKHVSKGQKIILL